MERKSLKIVMAIATFFVAFGIMFGRASFAADTQSIDVSAFQDIEDSSSSTSTSTTDSTSTSSSTSSTTSSSATNSSSTSSTSSTASQTTTSATAADKDTVIPQTGSNNEVYYVVAMVVLAVSAVFVYRKMKI